MTYFLFAYIHHALRNVDTGYVGLFQLLRRHYGEVSRACRNIKNVFWTETFQLFYSMISPQIIYAEREPMVKSVVRVGDMIEHAFYLTALFLTVSIRCDFLLSVSHYIELTSYKLTYKQTVFSEIANYKPTSKRAIRAHLLVILKPVCYFCAFKYSLTFLSMRAAMSPSSAALSNLSPVICSNSSM